MKVVRFLFNTILPLAILAAGFVGMKTLIASRPAPRKEIREHPGILVKTITVARGDASVRVRGTGTVQPHREAAITPQVSGRITSIASDFVPGGFFAAGDLLFEIERLDYELALERARSARAQAELELARQQSNARVARAEWDRLSPGKQEEPNPLVLYEPQLKQARAALASADTAISKAELDLERTKVYAPFNCRVRTEQAELGQYVRSGIAVASVAGSDVAEVIVPLPLEEVRHLAIPRQNDSREGSAAEIELTAGGETYRWEGRVSRTLGEVDPRGRMTRVVVTVADPYFLSSSRTGGKPDLEVGIYVHVTFRSGLLRNVFTIPRRALREGGTVWTVGEGDVLVIRKVRIVRREEETVIVAAGLKDGDRIVVTTVEGATTGMKLRPVEEGGGR